MVMLLNKTRLIAVSVIILTAISVSGCTQSGSPETIQKNSSSEYSNSLVYQASSLPAQGPNSGHVQIDASSAGPTALQQLETTLPWSTQAVGKPGAHVKMIVRSDAEQGQVTCQIKFHDVVIYNESTGPHPEVVCEGTLDLK